MKKEVPSLVYYFKEPRGYTIVSVVVEYRGVEKDCEKEAIAKMSHRPSFRLYGMDRRVLPARL